MRKSKTDGRLKDFSFMKFIFEIIPSFIKKMPVTSLNHYETMFCRCLFCRNLPHSFAPRTLIGTSQPKWQRFEGWTGGYAWAGFKHQKNCFAKNMSMTKFKEKHVRTWKWMVGRWVSFWEGLFSGAILVSRRVTLWKQKVVGRGIGSSKCILFLDVFFPSQPGITLERIREGGFEIEIGTTCRCSLGWLGWVGSASFLLTSYAGVFYRPNLGVDHGESPL